MSAECSTPHTCLNTQSGESHLAHLETESPLTVTTAPTPTVTDATAESEELSVRRFVLLRSTETCRDNEELERPRTVVSFHIKPMPRAMHLACRETLTITQDEHDIRSKPFELPGAVISIFEVCGQFADWQESRASLRYLTAAQASLPMENSRSPRRERTRAP